MRTQYEKTFPCFVFFSYLLVGLAFSTGQNIPKVIGKCENTKITNLGNRIEHSKESGIYLKFKNGVNQFSYVNITEIDDAKIGDSVIMCLVSVPQNCPPGDDRGKLYHVFNLRTFKSWTLYDSQHLCGGA